MWWQEFRLVHLLLAVGWLSMGLVVNLVQLILSLTLGQVSRTTFRKVNFYLVSCVYGYLVSLLDWWSDSQVNIYCDQQMSLLFSGQLAAETLGHSLCIVNHHTELDWLYCWKLASFAGRVGNCRAYAKDMLKWLPVIGWSSFLSEDVYLARQWETDKDRVAKSLKQIESFPSPVWLFLFPEGTRLTPEKLLASQEFSRSRNLPILEHHLMPRSRGFSFTLSQTGNIPTLIDMTVVPGSGPPLSLESLLCGRQTQASIFVRKFNMADLPRGEKDAGEWLINLFKEKDQIISCCQSGDLKPLKGLTGLEHLEPQTFSPPYWTLILGLSVNLSILLPVIYLLSIGSWITWLIGAVCLLVVGGALHCLVGASKIKTK